MSRKKKQYEDDDVIPFDDPEEIKRDICRYRCRDCGYEEDVPGYVIEEFVWWEEMDKEYAKTKANRMPTMVCPECEGTLVYKEKTVD